MVTSILWRRLDVPGHDACRLVQLDYGWRLTGTAVFLEESIPILLTYDVDCDEGWVTRHGVVRGWRGAEALYHYIERTRAGEWWIDGVEAPAVRGCHDLDLGFTPATNTTQLRRVELGVGEAADVPVAWLEVAGGTLSRLPQRYDRRSDGTYYYQAPTEGYAGELEVDTNGFVTAYPGLWMAEGPA